MNTRRYRIFTVGYCILILLVSTIPGHALVHFKLFGWDKLIHLTEYSILGWLLVHSLEQKPLGIVFLILSGGILFGAFDEVWQMLISSRDPSIYDWLADLFGVLIGGTIGLVIVNLRLQRNRASDTGV